MRKDVKFGLTIGAVLVVTLIVYGIVLTRGGSTPPGKPAVAPNDQATDAGNPPVPADSSPSASNGSPSDTTPNTVAVNPPDTASSPATQPAAVADARNDWNNALNNGLPASLSASAAPERTVTPTIDPAAPASDHQPLAVARDPNTPVIDPLPTSRPSVQVAAAPAVVDSNPTPMTATGQRTHRVAAGESPYSIAQAVYGNGSLYTKILAANPGVDPRRMKIGTILVIPDVSDAARNPSAAQPAASAPIDSATSYKVVSGDTLEGISRKLYGDAGMIGKIYDANQSLIGPNENVLKVGWILKLPQPPTVASAAH